VGIRAATRVRLSASEDRVALLAERAPRLRTALALMLFVQSVHTAEHAIQFVQRYAMGEPFAEGFLGRWLDFEWVHLAMNGTIGALLLVVFFGYRMYDPWWRGASPRGWWAFVGATAVEDGLHVPEHVVRIYQYLHYGWNPAPGILGHTPLHGTGPVELVALHFVYNVLVTGFLAAAFVGFFGGLRRPVGPTPR
jgi:hypothetical protein